MADMTVANTILAQYGGRQFAVITGAKDFVGSENSLTFKISGKNFAAKKNITHVVTTLMPSDTYKVEFIDCSLSLDRGGKREVVSIHEDVYFDQLQDLFEQETGLYTTLFARR